MCSQCGALFVVRDQSPTWPPILCDAIARAGDKLGGSAALTGLNRSEVMTLEEVADACANRSFTEWMNWLYNDKGMRQVESSTARSVAFGCHATSERWSVERG